MKLGVVVSCYRQERFLERAVAAIECALDGEDWGGALEFALPPEGPLPKRSPRWKVVSSFDSRTQRTLRPLTPGAGRMAGLVACPGDWVLFVDSDVELDARWVRAALDIAAREGAPAGIGGRLEEWFMDGAIERPGRHDLYRTGETDGPAEYLPAVALYRRAAMLDAGGYDSRLNSDEDFELALRLRQRGLELLMLGMAAGRHWSAPRPSFSELTRRWRTGICFGQGQVLRLYLGRRGFGTLLRRQWLFVATLGMWGLGAIALTAWLASGDARPLLAWALVPIAVVAAMSARKRSVRLAVHSLLTWTLQAAGLVVGLWLVPGGARDRSREVPC